MAFLASCAAGTRLKTSAAVPENVSGTYRLYLYGCRYPDDVENLAVIIDESSPYRFELYVPETSYRTIEHVSGAEAIERADKFLRCTVRNVTGTRLQKIVDSGGRTIAFEMRPLYFPLEFGRDDILDVHYWLAGDYIRVYIKLDPDIENRLQDYDTPPGAP